MSLFTLCSTSNSRLGPNSSSSVLHFNSINLVVAWVGPSGKDEGNNKSVKAKSLGENKNQNNSNDLSGDHMNIEIGSEFARDMGFEDEIAWPDETEVKKKKKKKKKRKKKKKGESSGESGESSASEAGEEDGDDCEDDE